MRYKALIIIAIVIGLAYLVLPHLRDASATPDGPSITATVDAGQVAKARTAIDNLQLMERGGNNGYERSAFSQAWADVDRNGCDTRNDILARDLTDVQFRAGSDCVVVAGTLDDPYTGTTIAFAKADASKVQIDHIFPLSLSWGHGSSTWTVQHRTRFANDPLNLEAVDGRTNQAKGDSSPAEWMPPSKGGWCLYATRFVLVASPTTCRSPGPTCPR